MAELTAARNNVLAYPVYGLPYVATFPILDADGDLVTGAAGLDSEISKNCDTFADCTNEATEIATSSGIYYLSLTATELTADVVTIIVKTTTTGAKTTTLTLYPVKLPSLLTGTAAAGAAGTITLQDVAASVPVDDYFNGCLIYTTGGTGSGQARRISDYVGSTRVASVTPQWATTPDNTTTYEIYLTDTAVNALKANISAISDDATAADNCELMFDGTGYAGGTTKLGVDVVSVSGDTTAADNAEAFFDGTGYAGTNNVIPTVTNVSNRVSADITHISGDQVAADNLEAYCDGTTPQPVNVTQMGGSALSTSSAQIGVNVIQAAGTAWGSGAITAGSIASNAIAAAKIATGAITNAKFAAGAIDAAAIAANAIGASELADDAVTEIVTGVWNAATSSYGGVGTYGQAVEDILEDSATTLPGTLSTIAGYLDTEVAAILADTNELQTDLANGGRLDLLIDAIKAKTDNLPSDPADQSAVEAAITAAHSTTNGKIDAVDDYVDAEVSAIKTVTDKLNGMTEMDGSETYYRWKETALEEAPGGTPPSAASIADAVWDEALSGHADAGSAGASLSAAGVAGDPWATAIPGAYGAGTAGKILGDNINAPIATVDTVVDAIKAKTDNLPDSPAAVGSPMTLTSDYDAAKTASSQTSVNTVDGIVDDIIVDTGTTIPAVLTTIEGKIDAIAPGAGAIEWTYTVATSGGVPISGVSVWCTSDVAGTVVLQSGTTNASGVVTFWLAAGTVYVWCYKEGYNFTNPDVETVS